MGKLSTDSDFVETEHVLSSTVVTKCSSPKTSVFQREKKKATKTRITDQLTSKNLKEKAEPFLCCLLAIDET